MGPVRLTIRVGVGGRTATAFPRDNLEIDGRASVCSSRGFRVASRRQPVEEPAGTNASGLQQAAEQAQRYLRLTETLERLAHAEEEAAAALANLDLSEDADELLAKAAEHYRWAVQAAQRAIE